MPPVHFEIKFCIAFVLKTSIVRYRCSLPTLFNLYQNQVQFFLWLGAFATQLGISTLACIQLLEYPIPPPVRPSVRPSAKGVTFFKVE